METSPESFTEDQTGPIIERNCVGDAIMADPVLVPNTATNETSGEAYSMERRTMELDRMALINKQREKIGYDQASIQHLSKATRSSTNKAYNTSWRKFSQWCTKQQPVRDPEISNLVSIQHSSSRSSSTRSGKRNRRLLQSNKKLESEFKRKTSTRNMGFGSTGRLYKDAIVTFKQTLTL
ncbi:unnamed protein product [Mucor hiemalis]